MTPEERKEKQRAYYQAHREHYRELRKRWVADHHDYWLKRQREYQKTYREIHPEKKQQYDTNFQINRLKKLGYQIYKGGVEV